MPEISSDKQLSELLGEKESAAGLDIGYYFHLLKRYLWLFLTIVVLATLISLFVALRQPKKYAARAVLQVEAQEQKVLGSDDVQTLRPDAGDYMATIAESLTSDSFLIRVAKAADLLNDPTFFAPRPDGQPYSDAEIAGRMRGLVSASVRKGTRLIDITATTGNPEQSKLIAATVAQRNSYARLSNCG